MICIVPLIHKFLNTHRSRLKEWKPRIEVRIRNEGMRQERKGRARGRREQEHPCTASGGRAQPIWEHPSPAGLQGVSYFCR
jgi:hypothetical protein